MRKCVQKLQRNQATCSPMHNKRSFKQLTEPPQFEKEQQNSISTQTMRTKSPVKQRYYPPRAVCPITQKMHYGLFEVVAPTWRAFVLNPNWIYENGISEGISFYALPGFCPSFSFWNERCFWMGGGGGGGEFKFLMWFSRKGVCGIEVEVKTFSCSGERRGVFGSGELNVKCVKWGVW